MKFTLLAFILTTTVLCEAQIIYSEDILPYTNDTVDIISTYSYEYVYDELDSFMFDRGRGVIWDMSSLEEKRWFKYGHTPMKLAFTRDVPLIEEGGVNLRVCRFSTRQGFEHIRNVEYWNETSDGLSFKSNYSSRDIDSFSCSAESWTSRIRYDFEYKRYRFPLQTGDRWDQSLNYRWTLYDQGNYWYPYFWYDYRENGYVEVIGAGTLITPSDSITKCLLIEERYMRLFDSGKVRLKRWTWVKKGVLWPIMEVSEVFSDTNWQAYSEESIHFSVYYQNNIDPQLLGEIEITTTPSLGVFYNSDLETVFFG